VENTLDESGNLLDETPAGSITDLPAEEEYQTEEGETVRTVKDESGTLISLQLGEDGSLLNLQIPPPTETEETTEESSSSYESGPQEEEPEGQEEEGPQDLSQQVQEQTLNSAKDFFGESMGRLKGQLQSERAELESLAEQVPDEEAQAQIQEMGDSYVELEESLDQSAQDLGVTDAVNQALQQAQQAAGQVTDQAGQAAEGAQDTVGGVAQQAQQAAGGQQEEAQEQQPNATEAAQQKAQELGMDVSQVEGTGSEGRITVKDVTGAANQG
jgi:pyruvate/2-oxoglutarate dehydrogenase complex dihydrolipoamide acyltransferase (E2) component